MPQKCYEELFAQLPKISDPSFLAVEMICGSLGMNGLVNLNNAIFPGFDLKALPKKLKDSTGSLI